MYIHKNYRPLLLLVILCVITGSFAMAQLNQNKRIEFPISPTSSDSYEVFPLGGDGALVVKRGSEYFGMKDEVWNFSKFNSELAQVWYQSYSVDRRFIPIMSYQGPSYAYWLFGEPDSDHFLFLQLDLQNGDLNIHKGDMFAGVDVQQFKVIGSKALVAGYYRNRPIVMVHSFFDHTTKVLPGLFERNVELNNIDVNEKDGLINVITYSYKKGNCLFDIRTFNYDGKLLKNTRLSDPRNSFITGQIVPLNQDDSFLIGNYAVGCTQYSQGLYVTHIADNVPEEPVFIEFSEMKNFFNYMKPKRKEKTLARIGKRKSLGKENRFHYRLLIHDLIQTKDEMILIAEVYYPNFKSSNVVMPNGFNRQYVRAQEGFRYTHALVCGFDLNGQYKWDNSFAIKDLVSFELQEMVQLTKVDDYFVLAYPLEGSIHTEVIRRDKVVVEREKFDIESKSKEKVLYNENANLVAWYDKYFMVYGVQRLGNESSLPMSGREVFYINKVSYKTEEIGKPKEQASEGKPSDAIR